VLLSVTYLKHTRIIIDALVILRHWNNIFFEDEIQ
jgi:hypothetical protein